MVRVSHLWGYITREFFVGNEKALQAIEPLFKKPGFTDRDLFRHFNKLKEIN